MWRVYATIDAWGARIFPHKGLLDEYVVNWNWYLFGGTFYPHAMLLEVAAEAAALLTDTAVLLSLEIRPNLLVVQHIKRSFHL